MALLVVLLGLRWLGRATLDRAARRAVLRFRSRVDRYKLTKKHTIVAALLADEAITIAVDEHAREHGATPEETWRRVRRYLDEIIPFFNILAYYRLGYTASRLVLNLFYKVSVDTERPDPFRGLPRDSIIIYLMKIGRAHV